MYPAIFGLAKTWKELNKLLFSLLSMRCAQDALRLQDERTIASTAKAHGDIWDEGDTKGVKRAESMQPPREPSNALTQRGFTLLVKLIEDLQFEKELERERGVSLVGAVRVV